MISTWETLIMRVCLISTNELYLLRGLVMEGGGPVLDGLQYKRARVCSNLCLIFQLQTPIFVRHFMRAQIK